MAPLSEEEKSDLINRVLHALSETPYACSSLTQLTNGTTNFVFRGQLVHPIRHIRGEGNEDDTTASTVIVKHSLEHAALNKNLPIDGSRTLYEVSMLSSLNELPSSTLGVETPRLHLFIRDMNIQVLEDFPDVDDLKNVLVLSAGKQTLTAQVATSIGHTIGAWLRSFHNWAIVSNTKFKDFGDNGSMRKLKYAITYGAYLDVLESSFPDLLEGYRLPLHQVKELAMKEFDHPSNDRFTDKNWGLIHGDFWSGNILLSSHLLHHLPQSISNEKLFVVDWEFVQFGHRAYDIGQMIGDLYERWLFRGVEGAIPMIEGFIEGYGQLENDEFAFRIAIHAGVHLIGWYIRRAPGSPLGFPLDLVTDAMRTGRDWISKGWQKDKKYFENTPLARLFSRGGVR
ncbi:kinase-like domain-containing protein [Xylaria bambusicola]|uniref:kinase-like domain-containing protein n=1 Tax=Xylaria bambusicola TaxID=326684 RepID=UPI002007C3C8|nr:kinase-like domain-containing protein [Xylaria bambusicola]KAI0509604.1 kinase-like domain-containing protein [Xylaria bambusicola]